MAALFLTVAGSSAVDAASYHHEKINKDPHYEEREISTENRPQKKKNSYSSSHYEHRNVKEYHHKDRGHHKNDPRRDNSKAKYQSNQKQEAPKKAGPRESENN